MNYRETDPQFMECFEQFAFEEVVKEEGQQLPAPTRWLAVLAALVGCQGVEAFQELLPRALSEGIDPVEVKEMVYQSVDYMGMGRMWPFLKVVNQVFEERNIPLSSRGKATTDRSNRLEKGIQAQSEIFGENMREAWKAGTINRWLAENCFGDYYTRTGLTLAQREMITFCFLMAQGGCEPQLAAHVRGNINLGNDREFLIKIVFQCLPYIGYPRSLNALSCINQAADALTS